MKKENHKLWVDIVKGIAIISVVLFHTKYGIGNMHFTLSPTIQGEIPIRGLLGTTWSVPVFLMIGGFFIKDEELMRPKSFIKKKWNTLYVKMLLFYFVFILLHNWFFDIGFYSDDVLYNGTHITPLVSLNDYIKQTGYAFVAAREPFLGAMWFVNLLFLGMCILSLLSYLCNKLPPLDPKKDYILAVAVILSVFFVFLLTHSLNIHIKRITPAFSSMLLIYIGYLVNRKARIKFDNLYVFIISVILLYDVALVWGDVSLADDAYYDIILLGVGTLSALYCLCYIAKKIELTMIGKYLSICGKESYYIMALHLLGFKFATFLLFLLGIEKPWAEIHSPASNIAELILYVVCGTLLPIGMASQIKKIKEFVQNKIRGND